MGPRLTFFENLFVYLYVYYYMQQVDRILASQSMESLFAWGALEADRLVREYEMGCEADFSVYGRGRAKVLRVELMHRGYAVLDGRMFRLKSGWLVA
jgi:hypothetical protein